MNLKSVLSRLEKFAPSSLAEGWDNVGLLIQPGNTEKQIKYVMLTNDLTENVLEEAIEQKADMIISYHPPIFKPLRRITQSSWKERITGVCLENEIALYSPHTAYDKIVGGVNDWLISPYGPNLPVPISPEGSQVILVISEIPEKDYSVLKSLMIVSSLDVTEVNSSTLKIRFAEGKFVDVIKKIQDYDHKLTKQMSIETGASDEGAGRFSKLKQKISLEEAVKLTKSHLGLSHVRLAIASGRTKDSSVSSVAVCAGSGSSVLASAPFADLWVTGEMSHHEVLDAVHKGQSVILCEHSNSERGYLSNLVKQFKNDLFKDENEISFFLSKKDKDPLEIV
uniref:NIF3-like protein 1 n=1 Tax=Lepeophtheirus salmonis TaxID=72036 RepID=D3PHA6_LEPSM|nr:NIF3-like protein 1 [Lepeophtheirus salmonis]